MSNDNINGKIYKIENKLNGKVYIGLTTRTVDERFKEHQKADSVIGETIRKYGVNNFSVETIDRTRSLVELLTLEQRWISRYGSFGKGYNLSNGGEGNNQKEMIQVYLNNKQGRFVEFVKENKGNMYGVELLVFVLADMFVQADSKEDKELVAKTISKLKPQHIRSLSSFGVINKEELLDYTR